MKELELKATPEEEDFRGKYESGKIGDYLLDRYFATIESFIKQANIKVKNATAIEIGCGEGLSTERLNKLIPNNITLEASEFVDNQVKLAKKNNPGMKITKESIYELKHKDNEFDLVFLPEVLEHLDFPDKGLEELKRITKKNGYLILGVPNEPLWRILNMGRGKYWKYLGNTPGHLNHWSSWGLVKEVEKSYGPVLVKKTPLPWTIVLAKKNEN